ncbi:MAG: hypothetical protein GY845_23355 [Planctomycetes bacterium]|nr:hypothetical protein [Planctomycetota bacterium]
MTTKIIRSISNLPVNLVFHIGAQTARKTFLLRKTPAKLRKNLTSKGRFRI